jgi:hypothetical protein
VLPKEFHCIFVSSQTHGIYLLLRPFIEVYRSHKGGVDSHGAVRGGAIQAQENAKGDTGPSGFALGTVKADLVGSYGLDLLELKILVGTGDADLIVAGRREVSVLSEGTGVGVAVSRGHRASMCVGD